MSNTLPVPIVDAHLHVWRKDLLNYDWLAVRPKINRSFVLTDYNQACGDVKVGKMVFIQAEVAPEEALREAEWVTLLAEQDPRLQAIVAWAPLELGDGARSSLEKMAANPRIKGVRRIIQFEPDQNFCLRPAFVHGVQLLSEYHFSFDICVNHTQLANTIRLVQQCPDTSFVLDHIGKPDIKNGLLDPWREQIAELARIPNVVCKISGLATEADNDHWTKAQLRPYINHVIDCFGFERVMFGGDWPVATEATDYPRWVETLLWAVAGCSEIELTHLFRDTASRFYQLSIE